MNSEKDASRREPATFIDATEKLKAFLAEPEMQAAILEARPKIAEGERQYEALAQLRKAAGFTQGEIAKELGVGQPAISELEGREDMLLSTLTRYLASFNAHLEVVVEDDRGGSFSVDARGVLGGREGRGDYVAMA